MNISQRVILKMLRRDLVEIQQKICELTGLESDLEDLAALATITAALVYGVDGSPYILEIREDQISRIDNPNIRERYRHGRYESINRSALREFEGVE